MRRAGGGPLRSGAAARVCAFALVALATACTARAEAPVAGLYRWVYPYSTPELVEDHVIVLDTAGDALRGWYEADRITIETPFGARVFTRSAAEPPPESRTPPATPGG